MEPGNWLQLVWVYWRVPWQVKLLVNIWTGHRQLFIGILHHNQTTNVVTLKMMGFVVRVNEVLLIAAVKLKNNLSNVLINVPVMESVN
jgi:hypothetical protein